MQTGQVLLSPGMRNFLHAVETHGTVDAMHFFIIYKKIPLVILFMKWPVCTLGGTRPVRLSGSVIGATAPGHASLINGLHNMPKEKLTKRKIQGKLTRQKIFDTSLEFFNKYGYENVTIDQICEEIGLSKGAFYTHFKSKDQIILEDFIHLNTYYDEIYQEISTVQFTLGKLFLFQQKAMEQMEKIGYKAVKLVYHVESDPQKKKSFLISKNHTLYKRTAELVREAQKKGEIRKDKTAAAITNMVLQFYRGIILDWCLNNGSYSLVKAVEQALPLIYGGIRPEQK